MTPRRWLALVALGLMCLHATGMYFNLPLVTLAVLLLCVAVLL